MSDYTPEEKEKFRREAEEREYRASQLQRPAVNNWPSRQERRRRMSHMKRQGFLLLRIVNKVKPGEFMAQGMPISELRTKYPQVYNWWQPVAEAFGCVITGMVFDNVVSKLEPVVKDEYDRYYKLKYKGR